eukprot:gnl/Dysnectes_brevis/533_a590_7591.p1 GENE.gnl/Dysnectes_brevis/533_a590_7591~~gnl/Dysnectes_brevis/533_a590_7591.p1  ORF type:complete len:186 (-),score=52.99 gnl/Dysnectes_brevis/533_a590_7591:70-627(-)
MGIDRPANKRSNKRTVPKSTNPYMNVLHKTYKFLERRSEKPTFAKVAHKRMCLSRTNRPAVSLATLSKRMSQHDDKVAVVVGTITNDDRMPLIPKMTVCALHFTKTARARIETVGGRCMSFDELLMENPKGCNTVMIQGHRLSREVCKSYGAPGVPGSHAKPKVLSKGSLSKGERARNGRGNNSK